VVRRRLPCVKRREGGRDDGCFDESKVLLLSA